MSTAATPRENPNEAALRAQNETLRQQLEIQRQNFDALKQRLGPGWGARIQHGQAPGTDRSKRNQEPAVEGGQWGSLLIGATVLTKLLDRRFPTVGIQDKLGKAVNWTIDNTKYGVSQSSNWLLKQADAYLPASIMDATKPPATPAP